jgi:cytochrome o ubiquinol oxidase subunit 1
LAEEPHYDAVEMPRNSPTGFVNAFFATLTGFALIWHIWWLVIVSLLGAYATFVAFAWRDVAEFEVPAEEACRIDRARRAAREQRLADLVKPA